MANNYNTIRKWAVKDVDAKLARQIRKDIDQAWANNNSKAKSRFEFLYNLGEHKNLPNAVKSIDIEERTKTAELQSCWMCGTQHSDTYKASCNGSKDHYIGKDCGQILSKYGLGSGVIIQADKRGAERKQKQVADSLDSIVLSEGSDIPMFIGRGEPKDTRKEFLGNVYSWLGQQDLPSDVKDAFEELKDKYAKAGRTELKRIMKYVAENKQFPADAFTPVLEDVRAMEAEGKASGVADKLEAKIKNGTMTTTEARELLDGIDHRKYRVETNTKLLEKYNEPLGTILNEVMPALVHDKVKWHKDYVNQMYVQDKVLNQTDYRLARTCTKRWMFGSLEALESADKNRVRNFAVNLESVVSFKNKLEGLVVMQRKIQYAKDRTSNEEYAQIGQIREAVLKLSPNKRAKVFEDACSKAYELTQEPMRLLQTPCVPVESLEIDLDRVLSIAPKVHARGWMGEFSRKYAPIITEHAKYGIVRKEDIRRIQKAAEAMKEYISV